MNQTFFISSIFRARERLFLLKYSWLCREITYCFFTNYLYKGCNTVIKMLKGILIFFISNIDFKFIFVYRKLFICYRIFITVLKKSRFFYPDQVILLPLKNFAGNYIKHYCPYHQHRWCWFSICHRYGWRLGYRHAPGRE